MPARRTAEENQWLPNGLRLVLMADRAAAGAIGRLVEGPTMRLALGLALLTFALTANADGWICATDSAAGFRYDRTSDRWTPRALNIDQKYILRRPKPDERLGSVIPRWVLIPHGEDFPLAFCKVDFNEDGWLECGGIGVDFRFRHSSLRYMLTRSLFVLAAPEEMAKIAKVFGGPAEDAVDDVGMEIGRCTGL